MPIIYIARHGKTEYNDQKRLQGWIDTPLNDRGLSNALSIAQKVKDKNIKAIYSSDLGRAFITAYLVARAIDYTSAIKLTKELREVSFGSLAGMSIVDAEQQYPSLQRETNYVPPEGESLASMQKRVLRFIGNIQDDGPILLLTHDSVINAIYTAFAKIDLGKYNVEHYNANDFVARIVVEGGDIKEFEEVKA